MSRELTAEYARSVLRYDPGDGGLTWKMSVSTNTQAGQVAGWINDQGYRIVSMLGSDRKAHRVIFLLVTGHWPKFHVDHINGVRDDNRWDNLRDVPQGVNNENIRKADSRSLTGVLGVRYIPRLTKNPFCAQVKIDGKSVALGCFPTLEMAKNAYLVGKRALHRGCTI